jgi:2-C-methyl-D-erythritol 4-phosphate cytidylyltransferase
MKDETVAIVLAGGAGERMGLPLPKQFVELAGIPLIMHSIIAFEKAYGIDGIVVVVPEAFIKLAEGVIEDCKAKKVLKVISGGATRQESSRIGVLNAPDVAQKVLIHDASRPFITEELISRTIKAIEVCGAVNLVIPSTDTIVVVDERGYITGIPNRNSYMHCQTPQGFHLDLIKDAHIHAVSRGISNSTDDCTLVLKMGKAVYSIPGDPYNMKITYPLDFKIAETIYRHKNSHIQSM